MYDITAFQRELDSILNYWITYTPDDQNGGFYGKINHENKVEPEAPKGSVLNARILWSFSAAYNQNSKPVYLNLAKRSYDYIRNYFVDKNYGGVYWTVDFEGNPLDTKKQIYALSFTIYGLAEYYKACKDESALALAKQLFADIEKHSFDQEKGGYLEAFAQDWKELPDLRLSAKDANEKKTMNTHLHVLEAYTNLYRIWKDEFLEKQICGLINDFLKHIIDPKANRLILFLDENWQPKSEIISYGHDIEGSWLLLEAAEVLEDEAIIMQVKEVSVAMARAAASGLDPDGSMYYEYEPEHDHLIKDRHWWVQAEAMVGFLNAWQLTGEQQFFDQFEKVWNFTHFHIIDSQKGEWVWGLKDDYTLMPGEDKVGVWKCPYHNSRSMIEVIHRLKKAS
ncbi:AGE family epimerase/isomerase [Mucilaginibacter arboris]|uniref:Cellobiose 2-epimerase n=1 Tax=Mucilaginibacter arboris TaxID=2682090 RepID=A0A7K1SZP9_9SPHI|nr:AGE family epimerase/isomerase [Mucilaginibacter arboris]MVN22738.1 N-acyl-D-glucosamine 2-epimerase [Mucilaginibacter arboris]